ncbi:MAG TPA: 4'-phosphopantetheinyl transferase superfamily protein [Gammaproteobacteria bacterium]|nr:4'-phosphopantetheinyl transferase superfamily protein [Gammaproteobacteria bacterium]
MTGDVRDASKSTGVVHVYYADRRALPAAAVEALVTAEDRQRVTGTMHPRRTAEYLASRALLRHSLARHTARSAAELRIETSADGKPSCVGGPEVSVSHSGDIVMCALAAAGAVGVDVETAGPRSVAAVAERFFTAAEARWVAAQPEPRFRQLWVLKEAYLKALGVGLAGGLSSLECRVELPSIVARVAGAPLRGLPGGEGGAPQLALLQGKGCSVGVASLAATPLELVLEHVALDGSADAVGPLALLART